jgi:hypothetical protein
VRERNVLGFLREVDDDERLLGTFRRKISIPSGTRPDTDATLLFCRHFRRLAFEPEACRRARHTQ